MDWIDAVFFAAFVAIEATLIGFAVVLGLWLFWGALPYSLVVVPIGLGFAQLVRFIYWYGNKGAV